MHQMKRPNKERKSRIDFIKELPVRTPLGLIDISVNYFTLTVSYALNAIRGLEAHEAD